MEALGGADIGLTRAIMSDLVCAELTNVARFGVELTRLAELHLATADHR